MKSELNFLTAENPFRVPSPEEWAAARAARTASRQHRRPLYDPPENALHGVPVPSRRPVPAERAPDGRASNSRRRSGRGKPLDRAANAIRDMVQRRREMFLLRSQVEQLEEELDRLRSHAAQRANAVLVGSGPA